jgi:hypothetical protein
MAETTETGGFTPSDKTEVEEEETQRRKEAKEKGGDQGEEGGGKGVCERAIHGEGGGRDVRRGTGLGREGGMEGSGP